MAKRLEITVRGVGGNIPSKHISYELHDLERLTIQCMKREITHFSLDTGCFEIDLSHRSRFHSPSKLINTPDISFSRGGMGISLIGGDEIGVTHIKIFFDNRATKISSNATCLFKDFRFDFNYVTKKGRLLPRINYSEEFEDLLL